MRILILFTLISYFAMIFGQDAGPVGVLIIIENEKGIALKIKVNILKKMFAFVLCWARKERGKNIQSSCFCAKK